MVPSSDPEYRPAAIVARLVAYAAIAILAAVVLSSCAVQPDSDVASVPGFFFGLLHGAIAPIVIWFGWLFGYRVYAFPNSGYFYDIGFMIGISVFWFGGGMAARRARHWNGD